MHYNLTSLKLSINVYNKISDDLLYVFHEAISNEFKINEYRGQSTKRRK